MVASKKEEMIDNDQKETCCHEQMSVTWLGTDPFLSSQQAEAKR